MSAQSTRVFIPDEQNVWLSARILHENFEAGEVTVLVEDDASVTEERERTISLKKFGLSALPLQNPEVKEEGVEDMSTLSYLHEPGILENLLRRFKAKLPYTYTGDICIAVNPYQWLNIYPSSLREQYCRKAKNELPPHIFAVSSTAYRTMVSSGRNQSILVSGESGAGKTESVKIMMGHCAYIASKQGSTTVEKLLKANPLLESFGNAKTVRNDNSSRFGKFIQLQFDRSHVLSGSKCVTYLLEKSRVVNQSENERNYHVLHQLLASPESVKRQLCLSGSSSRDFLYTNLGDTVTDTIEQVSDFDRFRFTIDALLLLGVNGYLKDCLLQSLSGLLHLGQISFTSIADAGNEFVSDAGINVGNEFAINSCCQLLGLRVEDFKRTLVWRTIDVEGQKLPVPLSKEQATIGRDALAKDIYSRIFQWLVMVINYNTYGESSSGTSLPSVNSISLLDIFGFESFAVNRFEQLCINYANEKLQQKFTDDVLKGVQVEYEQEGLVWDFVKFVDNVDVLEVFDGKRGLVQLINEESLVPKGSDLNFLSKLKTACNTSKSFTFNPRFSDQFCIKHFAGTVVYTVTGFLERNKDALPEDMRSLVTQSSNPLLARIFTENAHFDDRSSAPDTERLSVNHSALARVLLVAGDDSALPSGDASGRSVDDVSEPLRRKTRRASFMMAETVTTKFKSQLNKLMETISATDVQYVRCIKPNANKSNTEFSRSLVVEQLRSAGVVEAVRIARSLYPNRLPYGEFINRFRCLYPRSWHESQHSKHSKTTSLADRHAAIVKCFINSLMDVWSAAGTTFNVKDRNLYFQFGKSRLYLCDTLMHKLEESRSLSLCRYATKLQTAIRLYDCQRKFKYILVRVVHLQSVWRMGIARRAFKRASRSATSLQCMFRMIKAVRILHDLRKNHASTLIQSSVRMFLAGRLRGRAVRAVTVIASTWRMASQKRLFVVERDKVRALSELQSNLLFYKQEWEKELASKLEADLSYNSIISALKLNIEVEVKSRLSLAEQLQVAIRQIESLSSKLTEVEVEKASTETRYLAEREERELGEEKLLDAYQRILDQENRITDLERALDESNNLLEKEIQQRSLAEEIAEQFANDKVSHIRATEEAAALFNEEVAMYKLKIAEQETAIRVADIAAATAQRAEKSAGSSLLAYVKQSRDREEQLSRYAGMLQSQVDSLLSQVRINNSSSANSFPSIDELDEVGIDGLEDDQEESFLEDPVGLERLELQPQEEIRDRTQSSPISETGDESILIETSVHPYDAVDNAGTELAPSSSESDHVSNENGILSQLRDIISFQQAELVEKLRREDASNQAVFDLTTQLTAARNDLIESKQQHLEDIRLSEAGAQKLLSQLVERDARISRLQSQVDLERSMRLAVEEELQDLKEEMKSRQANPSESTMEPSEDVNAVTSSDYFSGSQSCDVSSSPVAVVVPEEVPSISQTPLDSFEPVVSPPTIEAVEEPANSASNLEEVDSINSSADVDLLPMNVIDEGNIVEEGQREVDVVDAEPSCVSESIASPNSGFRIVSREIDHENVSTEPLISQCLEGVPEEQCRGSVDVDATINIDDEVCDTTVLENKGKKFVATELVIETPDYDSELCSSTTIDLLSTKSVENFSATFEIPSNSSDKSSTVSPVVRARDDSSLLATPKQSSMSRLFSQESPLESTSTKTASSVLPAKLSGKFSRRASLSGHEMSSSSSVSASLTSPLATPRQPVIVPKDAAIDFKSPMMLSHFFSDDAEGMGKKQPRTEPVTSGTADPAVLKRVVALLDSSGLSALIFLSSRTGGVMDKPVLIKRKHGTSADTFDCELTGHSDQSKRFRFLSTEIKAVKKGRGKTISVKGDDWVCMHLIIDGKGELNLSLNSEPERDAAVKIFKSFLSKFGSGKGVVASAAAISSLPAPQDVIKMSPDTIPTADPEETQPDDIDAVPSSAPPFLSATPPSTRGAPQPIISIAASASASASASTSTSAGPTPVSSPNTSTRSQIPMPKANLKPAATSTKLPSSVIVAPKAKSVAFAVKAPATPERSKLTPPKSSGIATVVKHGWVQKEDLKVTSKLFKPFSHRYFVLELESKIIKYASTPKVLNYPSQIKGTIRLTGGLTVEAIKKADKSLLVEIRDGIRVRLRFMVESTVQQDEWVTGIQSVVASCPLIDPDDRDIDADLDEEMTF